MSVSDVIALGALLVAALTALKQRGVSKRQRDLEDGWREYRHKRITEAQEWKARPRLRLVCYTKDHVSVENVGGAVARNVNVVCTCPGWGSAIIVAPGTLPVDRIEPSRSVRLRLVLGSSCYFPLPATVTWTSDDGSEGREEVTLQLEG